MVTQYGLEGGALYQLTRELRKSPQIDIDFRPGLSHEQLEKRWRKGMDLKEGVIRLWRLSAAAAALIEEMVQPKTLNHWIAAVKRTRIVLERPRPIEEAISSAGGVPWDQLTEELMVRSVPGVFCASQTAPTLGQRTASGHAVISGRNRQQYAGTRRIVQDHVASGALDRSSGRSGRSHSAHGAATTDTGLQTG